MTENNSGNHESSVHPVGAGAHLPLAGGQMTGNITMAGAQTVDGVDVSVHAADLKAHTRNFYEVVRVSSYYFPFFGTTATQNIAVVGRVCATPLPVARKMTFDRIAIEVTTGTGVPGTKARLGIYADNGAGYPGALVLDAGEIDTQVAAIKTIVIAQQLDKGLYWLVVTADTDCTFRTLSPTAGHASINGVLSTDFSARAGGWYKDTGAYGVLADPFPAAGALTTTQAYVIPLRVASLD